MDPDYTTCCFANGLHVCGSHKRYKLSIYVTTQVPVIQKSKKIFSYHYDVRV